MSKLIPETRMLAFCIFVKKGKRKIIMCTPICFVCFYIHFLKKVYTESLHVGPGYTGCLWERELDDWGQGLLRNNFHCFTLEILNYTIILAIP